MAQTIEIVTFRLAAGSSKNDFLAKNQDVEKNFIMHMPGIIARETAMTDDGQVVVVLHWESPAAAQNSMDKFVGASETKAFTALLDMNSFKMTRYQKV